MFKHQHEDAPEGTLAHDGYRLYLAHLRFIVAVRPAMPIVLVGTALFCGVIAAGLLLLESI